MLTKEQILAADDLETVSVDVPEWGGEVLVSVMSGTARDEYEQSLFKFQSDGVAKQDLSNSRAKLLAVCLVDENGNRLFSSRDIVALGKKNTRALDRVYAVADQLNSVSAEEKLEQAKK